MDLKQLYQDGINKENKYTSVGYNMTRFNPLHKELFKAQYIKDRVTRQERLRVLLKDVKPNDKSGCVPPRKPQIIYKDLGFDSYEKYEKYQQKGMIYGGWVWLSYKRFTEMENHILDRFDKADILFKEDEIKAVCYLIDQLFTFHRGVFDDKTADYVYCDEYNEYFFDAFQEKINSLLKIEVAPIDETLSKVVRTPLKWNAEKQIIGTIFGIFKQEGIITGTYKDISEGLASLFVNLKQSTLNNNLKLNENANEGKVYYSKETERIIKTHLLEYVKGTVKKDKK